LDNRFGAAVQPARTGPIVQPTFPRVWWKMEVWNGSTTKQL